MFRLFFRCLAVAAVAGLLATLSGTAALAAGTPENAVLIIDPTDASSLYVGNYYKNARNIPDANVLYLRSAASDYGNFVSTVQAGFAGSLIQRNISDHADYVILAPLNAYRLPLPAGVSISDNCSSPVTGLSITAAFEVAQMSGSVLAGQLNAEATNSPFGGVTTGAYPSGLPPLAFHAAQPYLFGSPSSSSAARQLYIGAMLGYTQGSTGNSIPELLSMIDRSVAADGTRPAGTFYFINNLTDAARNSRACGSFTCGSLPYDYNATSASILSLGGAASVSPGVLPPTGTANIMGIMSGFANAAISSANLTLVPGAFADHLTSFGAVLDGSGGQTTVESWIAAGASGAAGSTQEPCASVVKFPSPDFHKYYLQGMSLGEAYLRSVEAIPFQMMLYGDPLTRPFAYIPVVSVASAPRGTRSGIVTVTPTATTAAPGAAIASYFLLVDGVNTAVASPGQSFSLDTRLLNDGHHDLRVLAYDNAAVQTVGRWTGSLDTSNYGRAVTLSATPASGSLVQQFAFSYTATGGDVLEVHLVQNGRVLAASTSASGTLAVYGQNLGAGASAVKVEAWYCDGRTASSVPVSVDVTSAGTPSEATPVAYSYSKSMVTPTAYVVELPSSFDSAPGSVSYTVLNNPTQATVVQPNAGGPYLIAQPFAGASGSETLQFQVQGSTGTSDIATVTLVYTDRRVYDAPPQASTSQPGERRIQSRIVR